jgi:sugar phosphate isomerase/epimerase
MKLCVSEATTLPLSFAEDIAAFTEAGCQGMEAWLTKLEDHLKTHSPSETQRLLADNQISLVAASYQGGLLLSEGQERKTHYDHFLRRLDLCQTFAIPTLLVVADFVAAIDAAALSRAVDSLREAAQWASAFDVRLALEFRSSATFCTSLDTALALVAQCGERNVGVNLDIFHYYTGPSKFEDLALTTEHNLAFVQVSDLAGVPRELAADADRVLPGDGVFQLQPIIDRLRELPYQGWLSLELMNPVLWKVKPAQVVSVGLAAMRRMVGQPQAEFSK